MTEKLGPSRSVLAVVLAGALVTYGGVSLFVAMFVIAPMGQALFRAADIPNRLLPAAVALGTTTFTMSAMPGTPAIQNAIPMPFFGTTPFAAPGLGIIASAVMLGFGLWWLARAEKAARARRRGLRRAVAARCAADAAHDPVVRERATAAQSFDPAEAEHGQRSTELPGIWRRRAAAGGGDGRQPDDVDADPAAHGHQLPGRAANGATPRWPASAACGR